jgi:hypothetical protein
MGRQFPLSGASAARSKRKVLASQAKQPYGSKIYRTKSFHGKAFASRQKTLKYQV